MGMCLLEDHETLGDTDPSPAQERFDTNGKQKQKSFAAPDAAMQLCLTEAQTSRGLPNPGFFFLSNTWHFLFVWMLSIQPGPLLCSQVSPQDLDLNTSKCNLASFLEGAGLWERGCTMATPWFSRDNRPANLFKPKSQGDLPLYRRGNPVSLEQLPFPELKDLGSLSVSHLHRWRGHSVPTLCNKVLFAQ